MAEPEAEYRVLVLMPTAQDAARTCEFLAGAGLVGTVCADVDAVCRELAAGAGAVLLTEEAVGGAGRLSAALDAQPAWSDVPLVVLTREGADARHASFRETANVTLVERPVRMRSLLSVVRAALRARRRQYEVRDLLAERERAAEALRAERERYRVTLSSIGDAVIATDAAGRVMFLNPVAESLTGWRTAEVAGRPLADVFHIVNEATRREVENPALRALANGVIVGLANHTVLISRDGTERPIDDSAAPIRAEGGLVDGAVLVFRDITGRRAAEAALRERDERLQLFLGNATDYAVIISDPEGRAVEWLGGAEPITGWRADEAIGQPLDIIFTPEDVAAGVPRSETTRAADTGRAENARWHQRKDGTRFFAEGVTVGIRGPSGELRGFGKVFRDATAKKLTEEALKESDRRKDEFIALLAHELRNPLAPIRNGLQVVRLSPDRGARDRALEMMDRQLAHMVRLIDDLLDVSRISRGKVELRRARILLADAVSSAVETARPAIDAAGHELVVDLPAEPVVLDADLTRLAQVFANLLTNSAKYTERGGRIALAGRRDGNDVVVSVSDTGIGIPAESLPRVFDMFSQVDRSVERSTGGLGIGLALVKGLVEMHGGAVSAASGGPGRGSAFTVRLPTIPARSAPPPDAPAGPAGGSSGPRRRILVVDDNRDGAESMAEMLRLFGNEVALAHDGVEAVERAGSFRPGVILMDVGMPRLNGLDATRRIREQPWGWGVTIIALTGWGQDGDRRLSKEAGCDGHLVKPVSLADLERALAELAGG